MTIVRCFASGSRELVSTGEVALLDWKTGASSSTKLMRDENGAATRLELGLRRGEWEGERP